MRKFLIVLIAIPIIDIILFILSGDLIGFLPTILLILLTGVLGGLLSRKQGAAVYRKVQRDLQYGKMPGDSIVESLCIFAGGLLLILPGFLSDLIGILLLIPFTRRWIKPFIINWFRKRAEKNRIKIIQ
ncbi:MULTISPECIES: FxsA family protein [Bacillus]|uniref:Exlusion protein FxsA n=2 Tax=Bacillus TaxID=1386 RepID=A0A0M4FXT7_9BACI|nr:MULTISPECIES: FxsA family protein [Bacillus]ALC82000.1 exlusion protein FxsA [Bacillus gobiensis]MBP1083341.1 UPF0716 protein FxsA [Bacillus capparidis]MED1097773.1 membrane protein FxsA [Bacillus capparidis]